jgi:integrase
MSVRKRVWTTATGTSQVFVHDYRDGEGKRHVESYPTEREAKAAAAKIKVALDAGKHRPITINTVKEAGEAFIAHLEAVERERSYVTGVRQHFTQRINPSLGNMRLRKLTVAAIKHFRDTLLKSEKLAKGTKGRPPAPIPNTKISKATAIRVMLSLKGALKNADCGVAEDVQIDTHADDRKEADLIIPTIEEVTRLIAAAAEGRSRAYLMVAAFCGLRASEIRGLKWSNVDLTKGELKVSGRADKYNAMGAAKTRKSNRPVPFGPQVADALRLWKVACPPGPLDLVFPNGQGNVENHGNDYLRVMRRTLKAAGIDQKYGLHSLRHFYASWCASRGLKMHVVSKRMGHSSIQITMDRYTRLFPDIDADERDEMAAAENAMVVVK